MSTNFLGWRIYIGDRGNPSINSKSVMRFSFHAFKKIPFDVVSIIHCEHPIVNKIQKYFKKLIERRR